MRSSKLLIIIIALLVSSSAIAGTILLMGIGLGTPGGSGPGACDGTIDLSTGCIQPMLGGL